MFRTPFPLQSTGIKVQTYPVCFQDFGYLSTGVPYRSSFALPLFGGSVGKV